MVSRSNSHVLEIGKRRMALITIINRCYHTVKTNVVTVRKIINRC